MEYVLDVHCHTVNSGHAYSTVSENAAYAAGIGLHYIGICDHAPGMSGGAHFYNFKNLWSLPDEINGVRVFKGVECNILNMRGELDLPDDLLDKMDFVIASFHRCTFLPSKRETHTKAAISAMENNRDMHIWGHPGDSFFDINVESVIKAAQRTKTIIEINNQSLNPGSSRYKGNDKVLEILHCCKEYGVPVLASSDAHYCTAVGGLERARKLIETVGLEEELILNTSVERFLAAIKRKKDAR